MSAPPQSAEILSFLRTMEEDLPNLKGAARKRRKSMIDDVRAYVGACAHLLLPLCAPHAAPRL